jgi:hypothetical protein
MCGSAGTAASVLAIPPRRELELRWHGSERTHQAPWAGTRLRAILITIYGYHSRDILGTPASLSQNTGLRSMNFNIAVIQPIGSLIAGVLILLVPRLLNYVVAIYLMATGIIGLWPRLFHHIPH